MANITQVEVNGTTYDICDATARDSLSQIDVRSPLIDATFLYTEDNLGLTYHMQDISDGTSALTLNAGDNSLIFRRKIENNNWDTKWDFNPVFQSFSSSDFTCKSGFAFNSAAINAYKWVRIAATNLVFKTTAQTNAGTHAICTFPNTLWSQTVFVYHDLSGLKWYLEGNTLNCVLSTNIAANTQIGGWVRLHYMTAN